ncbi:MAG: divalent cation tolerance protein CutA [Candidatus Dasytiphilus stammeri]
MNDTTTIIVLCTVPNEKCAFYLSEQMLQLRLAGCVTNLGHATSFYLWEGKIKKSQEVQMVIKTDSVKLSSLQLFIKDYHPYQIPEILVLSVARGDKKYLSWITECTQ